ncbi:MAG: hypothetical protein UHD09_00915 [Bifidobacterium sp.]|nr:hypothetical protein [Bifidobacterium sp.]
MRHGLGKVAAGLLAVCLVAATAACGGGDSGARSGSAAAQTEELQGARIATSLSARVKDVLERYQGNISANQKAILERALANDGVVTKADYELAWSNFQQCLADKGYAPMVTTMYQGGVHGTTMSMDVGGRGEEVERKVTDDTTACITLERDYVDQLYRSALGNPGLYQDADTGLMDCLRRKDLVAVSYTPSTYKEESAKVDELYADYVDEAGDIDGSWSRATSEGYSFDYDDPDVMLCYVANGSDPKSQTPDGAVTWKPFG